MNDTNSLKLDHITVVARSLDEGYVYIKEALGIEMPEGGAHPLMGTHNKLMSLGQDTFLELISIDPNAVAPSRPRWFNLDNFVGAPRLGSWVLNTDDLETALATAHADCGRAIELTRGDLKCLMAVADDGAMPLNGAFPVLMQWPDGPHPAANMTDLGCRLEALTIEHPR